MLVAREYRTPAIGSSTNLTPDSAAIVSSTIGATRSMNVIARAHTPRTRAVILTPSCRVRARRQWMVNGVTGRTLPNEQGQVVSHH
jgi:hypothetical protein